MASAVSHRYARALVDIVMASGSTLNPEDAAKQLRAVEALVQESPELRTALLTPAIQNSRKRAVMGKLLEELGAAPMIKNFVYVIIDHRRIGEIADIREAYEEQLDDRLGFVRAEVSTAAPLNEQQGAGLESELAKLTGKRMRLSFDVDPDLLGGVVARIGSTVYDGSVRGELRELGRKLTAPTIE
ncbi:MAG: ATP synthase F1 subunit delta [Bryobacterales bacterium]|nr:ATP synthase F1 subunit delta [Bryobacterales bacterium]